MARPTLLHSTLPSVGSRVAGVTSSKRQECRCVAPESTLQNTHSYVTSCLCRGLPPAAASTLEVPPTVAVEPSGILTPRRDAEPAPSAKLP